MTGMSACASSRRRGEMLGNIPHGGGRQAWTVDGRFPDRYAYDRETAVRLAQDLVLLPSSLIRPLASRSDSTSWRNSSGYDVGTAAPFTPALLGRPVLALDPPGLDPPGGGGTEDTRLCGDMRDGSAGADTLGQRAVRPIMWQVAEPIEHRPPSRPPAQRLMRRAATRRRQRAPVAAERRRTGHRPAKTRKPSSRFRHRDL